MEARDGWMKAMRDGLVMDGGIFQIDASTEAWFPINESHEKTERRKEK